MRGFLAVSAALAVLACPALASAAPCAAEAVDTSLTGKSECLFLRTYKGAAAGAPPQALVVVLHGDVSAGGPANYHFAMAAALAKRPDLAASVAVALVRPGYEDGSGGKSGGSHNGRMDHYTTTNIDEVAGVVAKLKQAYRPQRVVLLGHSGGAATAAIIAGRHPGLADGVVLVACPCHLDAWRFARNRPLWTQSESPHRWADKVPATTRVIALTGSVDDNTAPGLARDYVRQLAGRGVPARFEELSGAGHNDAFRHASVEAAVVELATR
ncbi:MAG: alpha/beta hydrolase family protein [Reyranellaceae bacterium]